MSGTTTMKEPRPDDGDEPHRLWRGSQMHISRQFEPEDTDPGVVHSTDRILCRCSKLVGPASGNRRFSRRVASNLKHGASARASQLRPSASSVSKQAARNKIEIASIRGSGKNGAS